MPYIVDTAKDRLDSDHEPPVTAGELTYLLQQQLMHYLQARGRDIRYEDLAVCLGALEGAKLDLIERIIKPYEAYKLAQNGDVWPAYLAPHEHEERPA